MRRALLISAIAVSLFSPRVFAQKKTITNPFTQAKKYTSLGAMATVPVGQFSSTNIQDGGYAKTGWGLYFDSKTVIKNGLYFVSHSTYAWVPLNQAALETTFTQQLKRTTKINGGKHMPFLTTLGLGYQFRPVSMLTLGVNAQGGLLYNSFKSFDITVYDTDNKTVLFNDNLKFDSHFSFAYVVGIHAGVTLIKDLLDFQITADYSASKFNSTLRGHSLSPINTTQQVQMVNVGGGIVVHTK